MLFALIAVVVLTLGAVALVRSVDTGMLILGNLGFRRDAMSASSRAAQKAVEWLQAQGTATLQGDVAGAGYYATAVANLAPVDTVTSDAHPVSLVDWNGDSCGGASLSATRLCLKPSPEVTMDDGNNKVSFVITRLCSVIGPGGSSRPCVLPIKAGTALSADRGAYSDIGRPEAVSNDTFYRIITRVKGSRDTVVYTETLLHF